MKESLLLRIFQTKGEKSHSDNYNINKIVFNNYFYERYSKNERGGFSS